MAQASTQPQTSPRRAPLGVVFGTALLLAGVGAVLVSIAFDSPPEPRLLGGNVPVNAGAVDLRDINSHNSPTVVRDPRNEDNLAIANRIDTPRFSCALHLSRDGGASWRGLPLPVPPGEEPKCYAPDVAFAADGTLYIAFVTLRGAGNAPNAVWLTSLRDGGTLSRPRRVLGPLSFQVRLTADPKRPRRLYLTWLEASDVALFRFTEPGNPIRFSRSDNGGQSWQTPTRVTAPARQRVVAPTLAVADEKLYLLYLDLADDRLDYEGAHEGRGGPPYPGPWRLVLSRSGDGGASWSEFVLEPDLKPTERFLAFLPPFPSLALDRKRDRIYAAFEDGRTGDPDVLLWASGDGGERFEEPVRVNDTKVGDGTSQYRPKLAVAPDGRLDVLYYDRRADKRNVINEVSLQSSHDGGGSFTARLPLSDRPFSSRIGYGSERGMPDLGSRLGLDSTDERALAVWTDTRAGTEASGKQDLASALVGFERPALSPPARYALRFGGLFLALAGLVMLGLWLLGPSRRARLRAALS